MSGIYTVQYGPATLATAITVIQIKAGATSPLEIISVRVTQNTSTASAWQRIQLIRKTAAATVTSFTPILMRTGDIAANAVGGAAATGVTATVEGTDGNIVVEDNFNLLSGWYYTPAVEERPLVAAGGIIGLKFPAAPASNTYTAMVTFREL